MNSRPKTNHFLNTKNYGVAATLEEMKESIYHSNKREPLGKTPQLRYPLPEFTLDKNYRFGVKNVTRETAKEVLFPEQNPDNDENVKQLYIKSHGSYDAGERINRGYDWSKTLIDPNNHRFGKHLSDEKNGVASCIHPDPFDKKTSLNEEPAIISEVHNRFIETTKYKIGKVKRSGDIEFGEEYVFGKKTSGDEWGAAECIKGDYTIEDQQPDKDLGKSLTPGYRNIFKEDRVFGCPTIRYDIKPPKKKSIADTQNYGKEPAVQASLFPNKFIHKGLTEDDFDTLMEKEEIKSLVIESGALDSMQEFDQIFEKACHNFSSEIEFVKKRDHCNVDGVTLHMFMNVMKDFQASKILSNTTKK
jgi:hypothetical protein